MTPFFASIWLEQARIWIQCGWFSLFGVALLLSIRTFYRPDSDRLMVTARSLWALAMGAFVLLWMTGAVLEMMRRAAKISGFELVAALAAFSVLLAGIVSLVREWFGPRWGDPLKCERVALSIGVLTLAGWWFGGLCLEWNALFLFAPQDYSRVRAPDGWALALGGAALLGASKMVRASFQSPLRVKNPRAATLWIAATALFLALPWSGDNPLAASVFLLGSGVFLAKIWRSRPQRPLLLRVNVGTRAVLIALIASLPLWLNSEGGMNCCFRLMTAWDTPLYLASFVVLGAAIFWLCFRVREPLRLAIFEQFSRRALLHGALAGTVAASFFFGPAGALFWAFWPLAGLFFDLLAPCELPLRETHSRLDLADLSTPLATADAAPAGSAAPLFD